MEINKLAQGKKGKGEENVRGENARGGEVNRLRGVQQKGGGLELVEEHKSEGKGGLRVLLSQKEIRNRAEHHKKGGGGQALPGITKIVKRRNREVRLQGGSGRKKPEGGKKLGEPRQVTQRKGRCEGKIEKDERRVQLGKNERKEKPSKKGKSVEAWGNQKWVRGSGEV